MNILDFIGIQMMSSVMRCPPDWSTLGCRRTQQGKQKLTNSAGLKRFVGEIAMIKSCDGKHTDEIRKQRHPQCYRTPPYHKNQQANNMQQDKGYHPEPVDGFAEIIGCLYRVAIKPAQHLGNHFCQKHQKLPEYYFMLIKNYPAWLLRERFCLKRSRYRAAGMRYWTHKKNGVVYESFCAFVIDNFNSRCL